jgi:hypothetical protein
LDWQRESTKVREREAHQPCLETLAIFSLDWQRKSI